MGSDSREGVGGAAGHPHITWIACWTVVPHPWGEEFLGASSFTSSGAAQARQLGGEGGCLLGDKKKADCDFWNNLGRVTYRCPVTRNETAPLLLEILEERRDRHMEGEGGKSIWTPSLSSTPCALFMVKYLLFSINFANITTSSRKLKRSKDDNEDDEKYV